MDYRTYREIIGGSKQYEFDGTVLTVTGYYTGKSVRIDLSKVTPEMMDAILADEEEDPDDGLWWDKDPWWS
ncbi:MAG: hypothetical protein II629_09010 [Ruminococcus sp.]|nr:hypothetical protein [Ruminococcus sp.]